MIGLLLSDQEVLEFEYMMRKELEELLLDLEDPRIDGMIHQAMEKRYNLVFRMYARLATPRELSKYVRHKLKKT